MKFGETADEKTDNSDHYFIHHSISFADSLVKNGIKQGFADFQPKNNIILSNEWLGFAVKDIPVLYEEILKGNRKGLLIDGAKPKSDVLYLDGTKSNLNLQQPTLFDFSRKNRNYELFLVQIK